MAHIRKVKNVKKLYLYPVCAAILNLVHSGAGASASDALFQRYIDAGNAAEKQKTYSAAEKQFRAALNRSQQLPDNRPFMRQAYHELAMLQYERGRYIQAEPLFKRAIASYSLEMRQLCRMTHSQKQACQACADLVAEQVALAECYRAEGKYKQAEALYRVALKDLDTTRGSDPLAIAHLQSELGDILSVQGRHAEAEALYKEALPTMEKNNANEMIIDLLTDYDALLRITGRDPEAVAIEQRLQKLRERQVEQASREVH